MCLALMMRICTRRLDESLKGTGIAGVPRIVLRTLTGPNNEDLIVKRVDVSFVLAEA